MGGRLHAPCSVFGALSPVGCGRRVCTHSCRGLGPRPPPVHDTPTPRGLAAHAECRGPRWPRRSRPRGPAPSTWPASAAAPGPARPGAGPRGAGRGTRRAAAAPPPGPGWRASGGPSLHRAAATRSSPAAPAPTRHPRGQVRASGFTLPSTGRSRTSSQVWTAGPGKASHDACPRSGRRPAGGASSPRDGDPTASPVGGRPARRLTQLPALLWLLRRWRGRGPAEDLLERQGLGLGRWGREKAVSPGQGLRGARPEGQGTHRGRRRGPQPRGSGPGRGRTWP